MAVLCNLVNNPSWRLCICRQTKNHIFNNLDFAPTNLNTLLIRCSCSGSVLVLQIGIYKALLDTASGLDYLHEMGVVHGDLKAANVLLKGSTRDARGFVCKLADFGLSRVLDMDATHHSTK